MRPELVLYIHLIAYRLSGYDVILFALNTAVVVELRARPRSDRLRRGRSEPEPEPEPRAIRRRPLLKNYGVLLQMALEDPELLRAS